MTHATAANASARWAAATLSITDASPTATRPSRWTTTTSSSPNRRPASAANVH